MSRARGKRNPPSSFRPFQGKYESSLAFVEDAIRVRQKVERERGSFPHWRSRWESWSKRRPLLRTRTTGLVGPEPDISARESNVPRKLLWQLAYNAGLDTHYFQSLPHGGNGVVVANHDCIGSFGWTDEQVKRWTLLANKAGIEFSGNRDYKLPKNLEAYKPADFTFKEKVILGLIPSHRRSQAAKIRRAARRGLKGCFDVPSQPHSIFVRRYALSAKKMRYYWHLQSQENKTSFQEFKSNCEVRLTLFPRVCRSVIPPIVFESLRRIYSKPLKLTESDLSRFTRVENGLKIALETKLPPSRRDTTTLFKTEKSRILKEGALVLSYRMDLHGIQSIMNSTIPRIGDGDELFELLDWKRATDHYSSRLPRPWNVNLNSWHVDD